MTYQRGLTLLELLVVLAILAMAAQFLLGAWITAFEPKPRVY